MAATAATDNTPYRYYAESVKRFCRSVELCDDYLRGYYGLKQVRAGRFARLSSCYNAY